MRLDVALVSRDLARSRTAAAAAIAGGRITVDGVTVRRASTPVSPTAVIRTEPGDDRVSRAGGKLEAALGAFAVQVAGRLALDVGASTGGFTQELLRRGARRVVALDVGRDQLVPELRADPRVRVVEGENARDLTPARFRELAGEDEPPEVVVVDVSFISLTLLLPALAAVAGPSADLVVLVKPQFEVGRDRIRSGVVVDPRERADAVGRVLSAATAAGLGAVDLLASPVVGTHGNREVLVHLRRDGRDDQTQWGDAIRRAVQEDATRADEQGLQKQGSHEQGVHEQGLNEQGSNRRGAG